MQRNQSRPSTKRDLDAQAETMARVTGSVGSTVREERVTYVDGQRVVEVLGTGTYTRAKSIASTLAGHLTNAVIVGDTIPAHDESFETAEVLAATLALFHTHVAETRSTEQANDALVEIAKAVLAAATAITKEV